MAIWPALSLWSRAQETWWQARENEIESELENIRLYRDYYAGNFQKFRSFLTERQRQYLFQIQHLGYNLCRKAVQGPVNRLKLLNLASRQEQDDDLAAQVMEWLNLSRLDAAQIDLYINALRDGAGYVFCYFPTAEQMEENEEPLPRIVIHAAYNGEIGIEPLRDLDRGEIVAYRHHWKEFREDGKVRPRRTDYYPDRIVDMAAPESGLEWEILSEIPWLQRNGRSLGLPIVEFSMSDGSKLQDLLGLQDALNKELLDFLEWADKAVYPTKYLFGVPMAYDESTGEPQRFEVGPDVVWHAESPASAGAQVGQLEVPSVEGLLAIIDKFKVMFMEVGNLSPLDFLPLGASPWSGEALTTVELSFLAEVEKLQTYWGNAWEDIARVLVRLQNAFGRAIGLNQNILLDAKWKDPRVKDANFWNNLAMKATQLGYSYAQVQREAGLSEEEIERMKEEQAEADQGRFRQAAEAMNAAQAPGGFTEPATAAAAA